MEVTDRIASLEQRVQMQEDEIQLLKSALADVVRRLNVSEEQQAMGSRRGPTKGRIHTKSWCLMFFFYFIWGIRLQKRCVSPSFSSLFALFPCFPPDVLSLSSSSPPICPLFPRPALLIALCVPRIAPAKLRKSPSADRSVGTSGRLNVMSRLSGPFVAACTLVVLLCVQCGTEAGHAVLVLHRLRSTCWVWRDK